MGRGYGVLRKQIGFNRSVNTDSVQFRTGHDETERVQYSPELGRTTAPYPEAVVGSLYASLPVDSGIQR